MRDRKFDKRRRQLIEAIEQNPDDKDNHLILAKFYFINECYAETIEVYKKLSQYYPKDIAVLYNLGVVYQADKQLEEAKKAYLRVISLDPTNKGASEALEKITTFK